MLLDATTDALEILLDRTAVRELNFITYYTDYTSTSVTPTASYGTTNGTASVNLIPPPPINHQYQLKYCSVFNNNTQDIGTRIRFNDNGNYRNLSYVYLRVSESIQYTEENGWRMYTADGEEKISGLVRLPSTMKMPEWFGAPDAAQTQTLTSATAYCVYLGKIDRPYSSVKVRYNVTTQAATISWAEIAIYKGALTLQTNTSLTRVGYTDVSAVVNSTGNKTTTITTSELVMGDEIWAVFSVSAGTALALRAGNTDQLGAGVLQTLANTQPSLTSSFTATTNTVPNILWIGYQTAYSGL